MKHFFLSLSLLLFTSSIQSVHAYSIHNFDCPLRSSEVNPILNKLNLGKIKNMDQKASESERVSTLNDLYALAEKNIVTSIQIFSEPNAQIDADPKLSGFYSTFVSVNHPHLKRNGELRKKAGRACRKAALAMIRPTQSVPELDDSIEKALTPIEELSDELSKTCFSEENFNVCLKNMSKATLMCTPETTRNKMTRDLGTSFREFKGTLQKLSHKMATQAESEKNSEKKALREAHYQIRLLLRLFPALAGEYMTALNLEHRGAQQLKDFSDKLLRGETLTDAEAQLARSAALSIAQVCRIDYLMDVRKVTGDILTWTSVVVSVAALAFGPVVGITLLPAVLSAGTTLGFLVGINVLSSALSIINTVLTSKEMKMTFQEGKISLMIYESIKYQMKVMREMFKKIRSFHSEELENELSASAERDAKNELIRYIRASKQYKMLQQQYMMLKTANFNRANQIINLFTFAAGAAPTYNYNQALFTALSEAPNLSTGVQAIGAISSFQSKNPIYSGLSYTNTGISGVLTVVTLQYSFQNLSYSQVKFIKEALESLFGGSY